MGVLGIDTSCYTTSAAYAEPGRLPVQERRILNVPEGARGLQQSGALFQHVNNLPEMVERLLARVDGPVEAVAASGRPRPVEGSYMPVFLAGSGTARSIAASLRVPYIETTHQQGHVRAAMLESGIPDGDFLAVHLSGGTTELLHTGSDLKIDLLGGTADLNAGQFVDRTGVALGLPFPCGPHLEKLAEGGEARSRIPLAAEGLSVHFSGAEAQARRWVESGALPPEDIAAEVYSYLARAIAHLLIAGAGCTGLQHALLAGGVASSTRFRRLLPERLARKHVHIRVYWGRPEFSADNAAGVAMIGLEQMQQHRREHP